MLHLSPDTEALIRARADAKGKTPEQFLRELVSTPTAPPAREKPDMERLREIVRRVAERPVLDPRSEKEITDEGWAL